MSGTLYICPTPIGNLSDMTQRCIDVLMSVDIIAAEDTRQTIKLLNKYNIAKPITSYHEHNKHEKGEYLISLLKEGKNVAEVSDAGTPAISDPGEDLVRLSIENGIDVVAIPGPTALINALVASGLPTSRFAFEGFLSVSKKSRFAHLNDVKNDTHTLIFYEAPHKLLRTLTDMKEVFGGERKISLAREMTKIHEEIIRTTIDGAIAHYAETSPRGEYVLVIEGAAEKGEEKNPLNELSVKKHVGKYITDGFTEKDAIKKTALDRNVPKREIYSEYHNIK